MNANRCRIYFCLLLLLGCVGGCARKEIPPTEQVRLRIRELEVVARKQEVSKLKAAVSETYRDSRGQDKKAIEGVLTYWFLRNQKTYVLTRVVEISEQEDTGRVHSDFFAILAGSPIASFKDLSQVHSDIFRFEMVWALEGENWNVVEADWRSVTQEDLRAFWSGDLNE